MSGHKDLDQIKREILSRLNIKAEYETLGVKFSGRPSPSGWIPCSNPYKKDDHPSCGVNISSGPQRGYLVAFNQNGRRGKPYAAWSLFDIAADFLPGAGGSFKYVLRHYADKAGVTLSKTKDSPPTEEIVKGFQDNLTPEIIEYLKTKRGLSDESIKKYKIGWSSRKSKTDGYNTYPVYDCEGALVNIRQHNSKKKKGHKCLNWPGWGEARLWGADRLDKAPSGSIVCVTEGEFDSMVIEQETGLVSVSSTSGADSFKKEWVPAFHGKHVVLVWDCDLKGRNAVEKVVLPAFRGAVMSSEVLSLKIVWLFSDPSDKTRKDATDYITKAGGTGAEILKMIEAAQPYVYPAASAGEIPPDPDMFFDGKRFIPVYLADWIMSREEYFHDGASFFAYDKKAGVWRKQHDNTIGNVILFALGSLAKRLYIADTLKILEIKTYRTTEELLPNYYIINVKNGMLDLKAMKLIPHDKKYYSTIQIPITFDPNAQCPKYQKYLYEAMIDDLGKINTLQDFAGYCFYPKITADNCLFLIGEGSNGKSVFLHILQQIIGRENITALAPQSFSDKFMLGTIKDKLLNIASEIEAREAIAANTFKQVVSGDLVQADRKFIGGNFAFNPIAKHVFSMNKIPVITDRSFAFSRRILVVRFNQTFEGKRANKRLKYEIEEEELAGVFNWALIGLERVLNTNEITETESMVISKKKVMEQINPLLVFVDEKCVVGENEFCNRADFYKAYDQWAKESNIKPLGKIKFFEQLLSDYKGVQDKRTRVERYLSGIKLKSDV